MTDSWYLIFNPNAAGGRARKQWPHIYRALQNSDISICFEETSTIEEMRSNTRRAIDKGYRRFISVGGDGSHHYALNAMFPWRRAGSPVIAIIPAGTGNDFARAYSIPRTAKNAIDAIQKGNTVPMGIGLVRFLHDDRHRYFINVAGMCLDAEVVKRIDSNPRYQPGPLKYLFSGVRTLLTYKSPRLSIETPDHRVEDRWVTIHAGIGKYSGGGMCFLPHGGKTGEVLAITAIRRSGILRLLGNIHRLYNGTIHRFDHVVPLESPVVNIYGGDEVHIEADGEYLGCGPAEIRSIPDAYACICPE